MGRLFIENEHLDYDPNRYFYCLNCKTYLNHDIEIASGNRCSNIECEAVENSYFVFLNISYNNIYFKEELQRVELHPNNDNSFILFDSDPIIWGERRSVADQIFCNYCNNMIGWIVLEYKCHENLFLIKKDCIV
jgi:hypothetical protein